MTTTPDRTEPRRHMEQPHPLTFQTDPDRGPITANYAAKLIHAVIVERPDWTFNDVAAALDDCRDEQIPDLRRAVFTIADRPGSTPEEIARTGTHWDAAPIPQEAPAPPTAIPARTDPQKCPKHPYRLRGDCTEDECAPSKKRGPAFWEEYERAKKEAETLREAQAAKLAAALEADRERLARLNVSEPRHV